MHVQACLGISSLPAIWKDLNVETRGADPNGFHLLTDGEDLVATLHLSRGGSQEELVLYLDLLNREDLLKFDKVADSVMEWEE